MPKVVSRTPPLPESDRLVRRIDSINDNYVVARALAELLETVGDMNINDAGLTRKARVKKLRNGKTVEIPEQCKPVSVGEINRELATLQRMFSLAKQAGKLHGVPHVEKLREDNTRRGFFERDQFESVRAHLPAALQPIVTFAYLTGWRLKSEVLPLEWRQVDFEGRVVRLDPGTTKNREGRTFPFTAALEQLLKAQLVEHERLKRLKTGGRIVPYVFHREALVRQRDGTASVQPGQPIRVFRRAWRTACRAAGVPGRILHDFRRTAVRNLERIGVPRSAAMAMVGHKTEAIYRRYAIVDAGVLRDAAARIDRAADTVGTLLGTTTADQAAERVAESA